MGNSNSQRLNTPPRSPSTRFPSPGRRRLRTDTPLNRNRASPPSPPSSPRPQRPSPPSPRRRRAASPSPPPRRPSLRLTRTPCPVRRRIGPTQRGTPISPRRQRWSSPSLESPPLFQPGVELQEGTAISPTRTPQQGTKLEKQMGAKRRRL